MRNHLQADEECGYTTKKELNGEKLNGNRIVKTEKLATRRNSHGMMNQQSSIQSLLTGPLTEDDRRRSYASVNTLAYGNEKKINPSFHYNEDAYGNNLEMFKEVS